MQGISYITDKNNKKKAVVIDYNLFKNHSEELEDVLDVMIAESRQDENSIPLKRFLKINHSLKKSK